MVLKQLSEDIPLKRLETKNNLMNDCKKHDSNVTLWGKNKEVYMVRYRCYLKF